jgi:dihydroorotate dehydrogenase electron transfer subunit
LITKNNPDMQGASIIKPRQETEEKGKEQMSLAKRLDLAHRCELLENRALQAGWRRLVLKAPGLTEAEPGQFVHLLLGAATDPLLRRPFSVHYVDRQRQEIWLLFQVAGTGTLDLAARQPGALLDLLGPLGRGFPFVDEPAYTLLVAGGIGLAPLYYLARRRRETGLPGALLIGAARGSALPDAAYFSSVGLAPLVATEDGSRGMMGRVTELLSLQLREGPPPARIHACGPVPMLAAVVELARSKGLPTHISLEAHLACGVGACLGCAFPFTGASGIEYRRVCRDGPVFDGEEARFE